MKILKAIAAIAILLVGPLLGFVIALLVAGLWTPDDPNFVANGGHCSPGDGFLGIGLIFASLIISVPVSILLAGVVFLRKPKAQMAKSAI